MNLHINKGIFFFIYCNKIKSNNSTVREGTYGINSNTKIFFIDQYITICPDYSNKAGDITRESIYYFKIAIAFIGLARLIEPSYPKVE